jgi:molybdate-binding protein
LVAGNPKKIYEVADLTRSDVRFISRQAASGTRLLLEGLLKVAAVAPAQTTGFEQGELTDAAVAAYVGSGMADVGFGVEAPARQFKLDHLPRANERYFLLCRTALLRTAAIQALASAPRGSPLQVVIKGLPGHDASVAGCVMPLRDAFPSLAEWQ